MQTNRPKVACLENVNTLVNHQKGKTLRRVLKALHSITDKNGVKGLYQVHYQILDSRHYGIPQNRRRVYFVCIRKDLLKGRQPFEFPEPNLVKMKSVHSMIDHTDTQADPWNRKDDLSTLPVNSAFINLNFLRTTNHPQSHIYAPTMLTQNTLWCVPYHRRANVKEHLRLQGFPTNYKQVVRKSLMTRMIGNSMTIDVLVALFSKILPFLRPIKKVRQSSRTNTSKKRTKMKTSKKRMKMKTSKKRTKMKKTSKKRTKTKRIEF